jgi:hypothetical protein
MLAVNCSQLQTLHICQGQAYCDIDVGAIVLQCPILETLEISQCTLLPLVLGLAGGALVTALQTIEIHNVMRKQYEISNLAL